MDSTSKRPFPLRRARHVHNAHDCGIVQVGSAYDRYFFVIYPSRNSSNDRVDAATNVARFVRLAKKGYYDGLTFHRVVANFVIQGGSPGANEFVGDGPFTRDELTDRSHLRGTIGISTRGRDTGDAQIFVNLVDNIRLDHNYTIIADVVEGMDVVDDLLEGGRIARVRIP